MKENAERISTNFSFHFCIFRFCCSSSVSRSILNNERWIELKIAEWKHRRRKWEIQCGEAKEQLIMEKNCDELEYVEEKIPNFMTVLCDVVEAA